MSILRTLKGAAGQQADSAANASWGPASRIYVALPVIARYGMLAKRTVEAELALMAGLVGAQALARGHPVA